MVYKHAVVAAFRIYVQRGEDAAKTKGEVGGHVLKSHGNYIVDHGKSWKYVFEFLWEPWVELSQMGKNSVNPDLVCMKLYYIAGV